MKKRIYQWTAVILAVCLSLSGCGKAKRQPAPSEAPNASVTYEKGRDFVGVIKAVNYDNKVITFYNTAFEEEVVCEYSSGTGILTKKGKQISPESLEIGQVVDVYQSKETKKVTKLQLSSDILEQENVKNLVVDVDAANIEINGVKYRYGSGFTAFSGGQPVDIREITKTDEVTFRGVKGKAYSIVVTKGHGYLKPVKYDDFVGGTMTIAGVMIVPVTENMLVSVPEGSYEVSMRNGDYTGSREVNVERDKQQDLDMSVVKSLVPNTGQVTFDIHPVGAELYVNGTLTDYAKPVSLKYGKHSVRVVLDGYKTYAGVIDVQSTSPTAKISLADEEAEVEDDSDDTSISKDSSSSEQTVSDKYDNLHTITVSAPVGASVYMDGVHKGTVPCSFPKKIGSLTITLSMTGLTTKSYSLKTIDDSKDVEWSFPDLVEMAAG